MKIAIDLSPLYSGHQFRGIGFYTKRLVEGLRKIATEKNVELEFVKSVEKLLFVNADIIHYPYFSPFFLSLPAKPLAPSVVTIHDLTPVMYMEHFLPGVKGKLRWLIQKKRLKKVQAVITDSQYWREEIPKLTGYPQERIYAIPLAAGEEFKQITNYELRIKIKKKYCLPENFVLYVGDVNWNKNVEGLVRAFKKVGQKDLNLVFVGKAFEDANLKETQEILQLIKQLNLINQIKILGYVPTEDLVGIYNLATVYCQPSFCEGFGLPVLEAMACGCPVVAAKTSSLSEICSEAAVMVDPGDINDIAGGIKKAVDNRESLAKRGLVQSKKFNWRKTAQQTTGVYEKIFKQTK